MADSVAADRGLLVLHHRSDDERGGPTALNLGVLDALTGALVYEVPLLSPAFPQDLRALYDATCEGAVRRLRGLRERLRVRADVLRLVA